MGGLQKKTNSKLKPLLICKSVEAMNCQVLVIMIRFVTVSDTGKVPMRTQDVCFCKKIKQKDCYQIENNSLNLFIQRDLYKYIF